jgi:murein DD-endopeptidase MepM/ murein hydrolase activator NlpD
LARHRSPSGAQPAPERRVPRGTSAVPGTRRLPPPHHPGPNAGRGLPTATLRGRATVAALAAGAVVAAAQSAVSQAAVTAEEPVLASALLPVTESADPSPTPTAASAIGGDQLPVETFTLLDADSHVDVQSLTKAVDIGRQIAERTAVIDAALAQGAPAATLVGDIAFVMPVAGRLTSGFGARWGTTHFGVDIANSIGTPIYAVTDGVVEESGPASGFGLWVVLRHDDGTQSVYGHINRSLVREGQRVAAGEQIAELGNRGFSTGPHLHFEIWDADGTKLNPMRWLQERGIRF